MALATATDLPEPGLLIRPATGEVERVDRQHDAVQTEGGEGVVEHQARRLGAVPLAPPDRLTDEDAELGAAVTVVDVGQVGRAHGPPRGRS